MIHAPHILQIGSTGRNLGKSTLACRIIERIASEQEVVGVKITTIRERDGECPRGGEGCGVCTSLAGDWELTDEGGENPDKDTGRMHAAGAARVVWLRVCQAALEQGVQRLVDEIGAARPIVCEGNSPRQVLQPGAFLMTRDPLGAVVKPTARAVQHLVDRELVWDDEGFDVDLDTITLGGGPGAWRWAVRRDATAVVMAGGKSRRMGRDKSLIELHGKPLIAHVVDQLRPHFAEVLVSANEPEKYAFLGCEVVPDREPGVGPLMGIISTLGKAAHDRCFYTACDIPDVDIDFVADLLRRAADVDGVVPRIDDDFFEPLHAVYRKSFLPAAEAILAAGKRRIYAAYDQCRIEYVPLDPPDGLRNINTPTELDAYLQGS